jgi:putative SOS response-associated peptidase YedK
MCTRFTRCRLNLVIKELAEMLPVGLFDWDQPPRFNIAPTLLVAAVRATADAGKNEVVPLKWGLIPSWSKDAKLATSCINARSETVATNKTLSRTPHLHRTPLSPDIRACPCQSAKRKSI